MTCQQRVLAVLIGAGLVLHGLGHAVFPMRAADVVTPGVLAPAMTALYLIAMVGFVATGLGVLGVAPLSPVVVPLAMIAAVCGLAAQLWYVDASLWPGVVLSTILPIVATLYASTVDPGEPKRRPVWKRVGDVIAVLGLAWVATSAALWPWHRGWGTTPYQWSMTLPGDSVPRTAEFEILHGVTIGAPPSVVWPWLVQIGQDRAGFYSYDWLERLFLADVHNVRELRPEWQARNTGDRIHATQEGYLGGVLGTRPGWTVSLVEPERALVLENWGAFVLLPTSDGHTRFLIRSTMSHERIPTWAAAVNLTAFQLPHFIMQRKMMLTIKALAEGGASTGAD